MNIFEKIFVNIYLYMESCLSIKYVSFDYVSFKILYDNYKILLFYFCFRSFCWNLFIVFYNLGLFVLLGVEVIEFFFF